MNEQFLFFYRYPSVSFKLDITYKSRYYDIFFENIENVFSYLYSENQ